MSDYSHLQLSPQGFLFDHHTGTSYSMNSLSAFILQLLLKGSSKNEICDAVCDTYEVELERAKNDLDDLFKMLQKYRLIGESVK
jgi:hypothetical protein